MQWLSSANRWLRGALNAVVIVSIIGLVGTMTVQVFLRYVLQASLMGVEEMSTLFGLWLYFAGFALVSAHDQHLRGGFVSMLLSERAHAAMKRLFMIVCAAICLYFLSLSIEYTQFVLDVNRRSTFLRWPTAIWVASLNLGLLLSFVTLTIQALTPNRGRAS